MRQDIKDNLLDIIVKYRSNTKSYNALMLKIEEMKDKLMKLDAQRNTLYAELIGIREDEAKIMSDAAAEPGYNDEEFKTEIDDLVKNI